mmetsp:Transcript_8356/g.33703  ORF Transcript_8356/g.33703 Transcript_8356/m.33703 type:complete len:363 (-) Transcript_8356:1904-2992(-)
MVRNLRGFGLVQVYDPVRDDERDDDGDGEDVIDGEQALVVGLNQRLVIPVDRVLVRQRHKNQRREVREHRLEVVIAPAPREGSHARDPGKFPALGSRPGQNPVALGRLPQLHGLDGPRGIVRRGRARSGRRDPEHGRSPVRGAARGGVVGTLLGTRAGFGQKGEILRIRLHELEPHRVAVAVLIAQHRHGLVDGHRGEGSVAGPSRGRFPRRVPRRHHLLLGLVPMIRRQRVVQTRLHLDPRDSRRGLLRERRPGLRAKDGHGDERRVPLSLGGEDAVGERLEAGDRSLEPAAAGIAPRVSRPVAKIEAGFVVVGYVRVIGGYRTAIAGVSQLTAVRRPLAPSQQLEPVQKGAEVRQKHRER